ncbi:MAG: hypothetical protein MJ007_01860 [Paludibacteraceae bacterium]|nr:hypothetical protein [Paludibacteraceae bacterium]
MSLIDNMMESCVIMNKAKVPDGQGGYTTQWTEGAEIMVAITFDTSIRASLQGLRAESETANVTYTLTTTRDNALEFHDVIKRLSDNATFRVTSDGKDNKSPKVSTLNMSQVSAERWELT